MDRDTSLTLAPALLAWWDRHGRRDLPWQQDPTPYRVWVSEIMLQQTQVATVIGYYEAFMAAFPTVSALADASTDEVLHRWSGLGYYARARNLHRAARVVRDGHGGQVPVQFEALAALPGIGRSTAGAILSLAAGQRYPILDGNVKRVLARVFGIEGYPGVTAVGRELWRLAGACTPEARVAHYTQAIMDLGATLCTRRRPACPRCPLRADCAAHRAGMAELLPARKPARARPLKATVLLLCRRTDGAVLLERRPATGIWGGLWGLPETASVDEATPWCEATLGRPPCSVRVWPVVRHGFSHFDLDMTPVELRVDEAQDQPPRRVRESAPDPGLHGAEAAGHGGAVEGERWLWYNASNPARVGLAAPVARLITSLSD